MNVRRLILDCEVLIVIYVLIISFISLLMIWNLLVVFLCGILVVGFGLIFLEIFFELVFFFCWIIFFFFFCFGVDWEIFFFFNFLDDEVCILLFGVVFVDGFVVEVDNNGGLFFVMGTDVLFFFIDKFLGFLEFFFLLEFDILFERFWELFLVLVKCLFEVFFNDVLFICLEIEVVRLFLVGIFDILLVKVDEFICGFFEFFVWLVVVSFVDFVFDRNVVVIWVVNWVVMLLFWVIWGGVVVWKLI